MSNVLIVIFAAIVVGALVIGTVVGCVDRANAVSSYNQINAPV